MVRRVEKMAEKKVVVRLRAMVGKSVKKQQYAHLRVDLSDGAKIQTGQFTLFDLVDRCFSFSQKRKQLAVQVLTLVTEQPRTFTALLSETRAQKSALHLTLKALEQSGLLRQGCGTKF